MYPKAIFKNCRTYLLVWCILLRIDWPLGIWPDFFVVFFICSLHFCSLEKCKCERATIKNKFFRFRLVPYRWALQWSWPRHTSIMPNRAYNYNQLLSINRMSIMGCEKWGLNMFLVIFFAASLEIFPHTMTLHITFVIRCNARRQKRLAGQKEKIEKYDTL